MSEKSIEILEESILNDEEVSRINNFKLSESEIRTFYKDKCALVTGATGFLGKVLLEKLLRTCVEITGIFILIRPNKKQNIEERLDDFFAQSIFDRLRKEQPNFHKKVIPINADLQQVKLGISHEDISKIQQEVSVFFHAAATVRFWDPLRTTVLTNVRGTDELLQIALGCSRLQSFVYFSTAFSYCIRNDIDEKFYEPPMSASELIDLVLNIDDAALKEMTPILLGSFLNNYLFSKAVTEDLVRKTGSKIPVCVIRPSIVVSTYREPVRGWGDNIYGASGLSVGAGTGVIHAMYCDKNKVAELVPVDMVANASIACAWRTATDGIRSPDPPVYNYVSSCQNPATWQLWQTLNKRHGLTVPTVHAIWYYSTMMINCWYFYKLCVFFLHYFPAYIVDAVSKLRGNPLRLVRVYDKMENVIDGIKAFTTCEWKFTNRNVQNLWDKLNEADKQMFFFDFGGFSWEKFTETYLLGLRVYLVKDPISTMTQARKKWKILKYLHYTTKYFFMILTLCLGWYILSNIFL